MIFRCKHVVFSVHLSKGTLSFKKDCASANKNHTELQVVPEHSLLPREPENLLCLKIANQREIEDFQRV